MAKVGAAVLRSFADGQHARLLHTLILFFKLSGCSNIFQRTFSRAKLLAQPGTGASPAGTGTEPAPGLSRNGATARRPPAHTLAGCAGRPASQPAQQVQPAAAAHETQARGGGCAGTRRRKCRASSASDIWVGARTAASGGWRRGPTKVELRFCERPNQRRTTVDVFAGGARVPAGTSGAGSATQFPSSGGECSPRGSGCAAGCRPIRGPTTSRSWCPGGACQGHRSTSRRIINARSAVCLLKPAGTSGSVALNFWGGVSERRSAVGAVERVGGAFLRPL